MQDSSLLRELVVFVALPARIALDVAGFIRPKLALDFANALLFSVVAIVIFLAGQFGVFGFLALGVAAGYCVRGLRKRTAARLNQGNARPNALRRRP
jgi:hypothetical protein